MCLLTWEPQVCNNSIFSFLGVAHKRQVNIQHQETHTCQEGNHTDTNSIMTCCVIVVEDALRFGTVDRVDVSFCRDAGKHDQSKDLKQRKEQGGLQWFAKTQEKTVLLKEHAAGFSSLPINFTLLHFTLYMTAKCWFAAFQASIGFSSWRYSMIN